MENQIPDQHQGFNSSINWSPDEESTFLDTLVEEFINKQPEAMDALVALVLFRVSKITDEGWARVAIRMTELTGKKYTMMELNEQMKRVTHRFQGMENLFGHGGSGMNNSRISFEPYSERGNDTAVYRPPYENVPTLEKDATSSDGRNASVLYPEECVRNTNRSSSKVLNQEGDPGMDFPRSAFIQTFEREKDTGICRSPDENFLIPKKGCRNSDGCNGSVPYPDKCIGNSNRSFENVSRQEGGRGMSIPRTKFELSDEPESDAWIRQSPGGNVSIPEMDFRKSDGCNGSVPYPEVRVRNSIGNCDNDFHLQENVVDSGVNQSVPYPREYENAEYNIDDSGVNHNVNHRRGHENAMENARESKGSRCSTSKAYKNCGSSIECKCASSPLVNVESINQRFDSVSGQEEKAACSTPRYEGYDAKESMGLNKSPTADPLDSGDYKRNKWSSYSQKQNTCRVDRNPDDGDSFSVARCRNILHGMRRIDNQFRDTALDFLEDPYYRKFFMQMKHNKRLEWLNSILGMEH